MYTNTGIIELNDMEIDFVNGAGTFQDVIWSSTVGLVGGAIGGGIAGFFIAGPAGVLVGAAGGGIAGAIGGAIAGAAG